jgi:hypothetical protein
MAAHTQIDVKIVERSRPLPLPRSKSVSSADAIVQV